MGMTKFEGVEGGPMLSGNTHVRNQAIKAKCIYSKSSIAPRPEIIAATKKIYRQEGKRNLWRDLPNLNCSYLLDPGRSSPQGSNPDIGALGTLKPTYFGS